MLDNLGGVIRAGIIYDEVFEMRIVLVEDALDALGQILCLVVARSDE